MKPNIEDKEFMLTRSTWKVAIAKNIVHQINWARIIWLYTLDVLKNHLKNGSQLLKIRNQSIYFDLNS